MSLPALELFWKASSVQCHGCSEPPRPLITSQCRTLNIAISEKTRLLQQRFGHTQAHFSFQLFLPYLHGWRQQKEAQERFDGWLKSNVGGDNVDLTRILWALLIWCVTCSDDTHLHITLPNAIWKRQFTIFEKWVENVKQSEYHSSWHVRPLCLDFPKKKTFYMMRKTHWNQLFTFNFWLIFMSVWANVNTADTCQISHFGIEIKKKKRKPQAWGRESDRLFWFADSFQASTQGRRVNRSDVFCSVIDVTMYSLSLQEGEHARKKPEAYYSVSAQTGLLFVIKTS